MFKEFLLKIYKSFRQSEAPFEHLAKVAIATESQIALDRSQAAIYTTGLFSLNMIDTGASTNTGKLEAAIASSQITEDEFSPTNPCLVDSKHVIDDESILQGVVNLEDDAIVTEPLIKVHQDDSLEVINHKEEIEAVVELVENNDATKHDDTVVNSPTESEFALDIFANKEEKEITPVIEETTSNTIPTSNIIWEEMDESSIGKKGKKAKKKGKKKKKQVAKVEEKLSKKKKKEKKSSNKKENRSKNRKKEKSKVKHNSKKNKSVKKNQNTVGLNSYGNYPASAFTSWVYKLEPLENGFLNNKESKKKSSKKKKKLKHKAVKASALKSITLKEDIATETLVNILIAQGHKEKAINMIDKLIVQQPQDATRLTILQQSLLGK